jgi:hypothetical protein
MRKQVFAVAAILCFCGAVRSYAADLIPLNDILTKTEQAEPNFGPPRGKLTPSTAVALARELPDDRFVADQFPATRLIYPDGTAEPYVSARVLKVLPLTGDQALKAYAKDFPTAHDTAKIAQPSDDTPIAPAKLLFDQRRVKEWSK